MTKKLQLQESEELSKAIVEGMQELKANNIVSLDLRKLHEATTDFFVLCHANSSTQVKAIADSVEEVVYKTIGEQPIRKEGESYGEWILVDFGNVVAHIFKTEKREFYNLERLWSQAAFAQY